MSRKAHLATLAQHHLCCAHLAHTEADCVLYRTERLRLGARLLMRESVGMEECNGGGLSSLAAGVALAEVAAPLALGTDNFKHAGAHAAAELRKRLLERRHVELGAPYRAMVVPLRQIRDLAMPLANIASAVGLLTLLPVGGLFNLRFDQRYQLCPARSCS